MSENWRLAGQTGQDAGAYFNQQKKKLDVADRRPVVRKPSDLVGPGISKGATRITDWNDTLATFSGYYSSLAGALNAPDLIRAAVDQQAFIGEVTSDPTLGGKQTLTGLSSGTVFRRTFLRNQYDPSYIKWGAWTTDESFVSSMMGTTTTTTTMSQNSETLISPPQVAYHYPFYVALPFSRDANGINILRAGTYTGYLRLSTATFSTISELKVIHPYNNTLTTLVFNNLAAGNGIVIPFSFYSTTTTGYIRVLATQTVSSTALDMRWSNLSVVRFAGLA